MTVLLIDIDSVLADWNYTYDSLLEGLAQFDDVVNEIPRSKDQPTFDLFTGRSKIHQDIIHTVMDTPSFYRHLNVYDGAKESLMEMARDGYDVFLVSTPHITNPTCASDKYAWVNQYLGEYWAKRTILTHDKTMIHGDILVDDREDISGHMEPSWTQVLFTQPWNVNEPMPRIESWLGWEWKAVLNRVIEERESK